MKLGTNDIGSVYLGTNAVQKVYLGTNEVWSSFTPDADAQAFFDRVTTAGGSLTNTEKTAVNQLVLDMKDDGIWTKMKAIYPMVGASAAACAQNLKSSSFTGTFTATGWDFASTGATPNGFSAYMDTGLLPSSQLSVNNVSFGHSTNTNFTPSAQQDYGCIQTVSYLPLFGLSYTTSGAVLGYVYNFNTGKVVTATTSTNGNFAISRTSSTSLKGYKNGIQIGSTITSANTDALVSAVNFTFGAMNRTFGGALQGFNTFQYQFAFIGDGLSDSDADKFNTAIQSFQTTLGR